MSPEPVTSHGAAAARGASGQLPDRSHVLKVVFKSEQVLAPSRAGSHAPRAPQLRVAMPLRHLPPALSAWYTGTAARLRQSRRDMSTRGMGPSEAGGLGFPKWPCVGRRSAGRGERGRRDGQPQAQKPHQPHRLHRPPTRHDHGRAGARPAARDEAAAEGRGQAQTGALFRHSESAARPRRGRSSSGATPSVGEAEAPPRATPLQWGFDRAASRLGRVQPFSELLGASRMNCHTSSESRGENLGVRGGIAKRALTARARRGYVAHLASSRRS
jgi:hypothetical protein